INLWNPTHISLGIDLLTALLLGMLHGVTPDEHTWPITFSYAVGSYSTMRPLLKPIGLLLLLLILTQQGAVVHELGHLIGADRTQPQADAGTSADATCPLCAEFARVVTPAFSYAFQIPRLVLAEPELGDELRHTAIDATVPGQRSRGPPSSS
ncbi:MAG TPA: DUF2946 family protein, partial [Nitrolancea sp.]|nr:DUF2946 family protein [Nitrolancea sp.]